MEPLTQAEQREQLEKFIKRSYDTNEEKCRINGKNLFIYIDNDTYNREVKQHNTEYFSVKPPWEVKYLLEDGLIDIKRIQFTMYHDEDDVDEEELRSTEGIPFDEVEEIKGSRGDRKFDCFFHCIIQWDSFTEEQDLQYWRANVHYP